MPRLKIAFVAPPFSGHLHPILGLAKLVEDVAEVFIVSTPGAIAEAERSGLRGRSILPDREALIHAIVAPGRPVRSNPFLLYRQLRANVSMQGEMLGALESVCREERPDLILADFTIPVAGVVAQRLGLPWWTSLPSPCVFETPDGPPAYCGGLAPARNAAEAALHRLLRAGTRAFKHLMFRTFRKTFCSVGLTSVYREDGSERVYSPELILALGLPELEFPRTYPAHFRFLGPILHTPPAAGPAPHFEAGRRHVLISLGTHLDHHRDDLARVARRLAAEQTEWVFHLTEGRAGGEVSERSGNLHRYSFVSYAEHLPRYDLVIHHGGTGILYHTLRRGLPAVVLPLDFDQFDYAARLAAAGVAVWARGFEDLPRAFAEAVQHGRLRDRAEALRRAIEGMDARTWLYERLLRLA